MTLPHRIALVLVIALGLASELQAAAISTAEVTGLRVTFSGLDAGGCSELGVVPPGTSLGPTSCSTVDGNLILSAESILAAGSASNPNIVPDASGSYPVSVGDGSGGSAEWAVTILPPLSGTEIWLNLAFSYAYDLSVSGFEAPSFQPYASGLEEASVTGAIALLGVYPGGSDYLFLHNTFTPPGTNPNIFLNWSSGEPPSSPISGAGVLNVAAPVIGRSRPISEYAYLRLTASAGASAFNVQVVPEPSTLILATTGIVALALARRRKHFQTRQPST